MPCLCRYWKHCWKSTVHNLREALLNVNLIHYVKYVLMLFMFVQCVMYVLCVFTSLVKSLFKWCIYMTCTPHGIVKWCSLLNVAKVLERIIVTFLERVNISILDVLHRIVYTCFGIMFLEFIKFCTMAARSIRQSTWFTGMTGCQRHSLLLDRTQNQLIVCGRWMGLQTAGSQIHLSRHFVNP